MEKDYENYEYIKVKIKYTLADECRNSYQAFGWEVLSEGISGEGRVFQFRRNKKLKNRMQVMEQQRRMEDAFVALERMEYQRELGPTLACILVGMTGAACIAASILSLQADRYLWFFLLEIPGIGLCTIPIWMKKWLMKWREKDYAEAIERQRHLIMDAVRKGQEWL